MEIRARYFLIGLFTVFFLGGLSGFIIWSGGLGADPEGDLYYIYFETSVAGLSVGGDVRYNGVQVGTVSEILLVQSRDSGQGNEVSSLGPQSCVRVTVEVQQANQPIVVNDETAFATLQLQGLTGVLYVQLADKPQDQAGRGLTEGNLTRCEPLPYSGTGPEPRTIRSEQSEFEQLFSRAPNLLADASVTLSRVDSLLGDENLQLVTGILSNTNDLMATLEGDAEDIGPLIVRIDEFIVQMQTVAESIDRFANTANDVIDDDLPDLVADLRDSARVLNEVLTASGEDLNAFTATALPEFTAFASDARRLAATLTRIADRFEREPLGFVLGGETPEMELD